MMQVSVVQLFLAFFEADGKSVIIEAHPSH